MSKTNEPTLDDLVDFKLKEILSSLNYTPTQAYNVVCKIFRDYQLLYPVSDIASEKPPFTLQTFYNYVNGTSFPTSKLAFFLIIQMLREITGKYLALNQVLNLEGANTVAKPNLEASKYLSEYKFQEALVVSYKILEDLVDDETNYVENIDGKLKISQTLHEIGICHFALGQFYNSLRRQLQARYLLEKDSNELFGIQQLKKQLLLAKINIRIGNSLRTLGRTFEATRACDSGLESLFNLRSTIESSSIVNQPNNTYSFQGLSINDLDLEESDGLRIKAHIKHDEGDFETAKTILRMANAILPHNIDPNISNAHKYDELRGKINFVFGKIYSSLGYCFNAKIMFEKSYDYFFNINSEYFLHLTALELAKNITKLARNYTWRDRKAEIAAAEDYLNDAKKFFEPQKQPYGLALCFKAEGYLEFFKIKHIETQKGKNISAEPYRKVVQLHEKSIRNVSTQSANLSWNNDRLKDYTEEFSTIRYDINTRRIMENYIDKPFELGHEYTRLGICYQKIANVTKEESDYLKALDYYEKANAILGKEPNQDLRGMRMTCNRRGRIFLRMNKIVSDNINEAFKVYKNAEELFFRSHYAKNAPRADLITALWDQELGYTYMGLGDVYFEKDELLESLRYYKLAVTVFDQINEKLDRAYGYYHLSKVYNSLASKKEENQPESSITYLMRAHRYNRLAIKYFKEINYSIGKEKAKEQREHLEKITPTKK